MPSAVICLGVQARKKQSAACQSNAACPAEERIAITKPLTRIHRPSSVPMPLSPCSDLRPVAQARLAPKVQPVRRLRHAPDHARRRRDRVRDVLPCDALEEGPLARLLGELGLARALLGLELAPRLVAQDARVHRLRAKTKGWKG